MTKMTPEEFTEVRLSLDLSPTQLAESLGVTYQAVKDWQSGRRKISKQLEKQLECLIRVQCLEAHNKQRQSDV